jgi:hypothetical protein
MWPSSESESPSEWKWICSSSGAMRTCLTGPAAAEEEDAIAGAGGGDAAGRPCPFRCGGRRSSGSGGGGGSVWTPRRKSWSTAPTERSDSA